MKDTPLIALVEPSFYGIGYIDATISKGCRFISIVSSSLNPAKYGYKGKEDAVIVADIRNSDSIYAAIKSSPYYGKIDALIPATDYATHITSMVSKKLGLWHVNCDAALRARNKDLARARYHECGVPNANYMVITSYTDAKMAAAKIGYPIIVKPTNCASSQNVFMVRTDKELRGVMKIVKNFRETYMGFKTREEYLVEEYIDGPEFSVEIFFSKGEVGFASVTEKLTTPPPYFAELAHTVPTPSYLDKKQHLIDTATKAVKALGFETGACHVELKLSSRGPVIIETNGRPGGDEIAKSLLINAYGLNFFEATVDAYLNHSIDLTPKKNMASSIAYLTAERKGILSHIHNIDQLGKKKNVKFYKITASPGDQVEPAKNSDDRLGYVITVAPTPIEAKQSALDAITSIELGYLN